MKKGYRFRTALFVLAAQLIVTTSISAARFTYYPPGDLVPGSGQGRVDYHVYMPDMRFPVESTPAYAKSGVYEIGGSKGPPGSQCDQRNYSYPWRDNYCENRSWSMPMCPAGTGHQGQDIRGSTCVANKWWTVAVENGVITSIGTYSVYLQGDSGIRHRYLHLKMSQLAVSQGQRVRKGQRIGKISNDFGGTPTHIHVHFDMHSGGRYIPTYMSLVKSYQRLFSGDKHKSIVDQIMAVILED